MSSISSPEGSAEWHYEEATRLLRLDDEVPPDEYDPQASALTVAAAQVHATLALYRIEAGR